jgi:hypothetical protein
LYAYAFECLSAILALPSTTAQSCHGVGLTSSLWTGRLRLGAGLIGAGICAFVMRRKAAAPDNSSLMLLQNQLAGLTQAVENRLGGMEAKIGAGSEQMVEHIRKQFGESARLAGDIRDTVHKQITAVAEGAMIAASTVSPLAN